MTTERPVWTGIGRGFTDRCPTCGKGRLFGRFLKPVSACPVCATDNSVYPADDLPPYLVVMLVGHLVVPLFMWSDRALAPALWLQFVIWLPLTALLCLVLLQPVKGAVIGLCWARGMVRPAAG